MMYKIKLPWLLDACPVYWQNFIRIMRPIGEQQFGERWVIAKLPEFNSRWTGDDWDSAEAAEIEFETEEDFLAFKLKFS